MAQKPREDKISANKLYEMAKENGLTNVSFAEWIENKNLEYTSYVKQMNESGVVGGLLDFDQWEVRNQEDAIEDKKPKSGLLPTLAVIAILGGIIYFSLKSSK